jgi:hypothetical protein
LTLSGGTVARDLVCFSHLRWDFVYQRPNHLMARAARDRRVFFVEEPVVGGDAPPRLTTLKREGVLVVKPELPEGLSVADERAVLARLMDEMFRSRQLRRPVLWYYTPMALPWTRALDRSAVVYDSMDHLAGFRGAAPELLALEEELLAVADLVFCGGTSLHERMARRHPATHCFPSSVDVAHFRKARADNEDPEDQAGIARPRIGYAGVIDERIDLDLIRGVAAARPDWQIVLVGPIAKIAHADLPTGSNIHRLGIKAYAELPSYLAGWDVGWMPFARNEATRYISPTKTPEYLAAGLPVVSTSIRDVVEPYGRQGLVSIADCVETTVEVLEQTLAEGTRDPRRADAFLAERSWDRTWSAMAQLVDELEPVNAPLERLLRRRPATPNRPSTVPVGVSAGASANVAASVSSGAREVGALSTTMPRATLSAPSSATSYATLPTRSGRTGRGG